MRRSLRVWLTTGLVLLGVGPLASAAQGPPAQERGRLEQEVRRRFQARVVQELGLSAEQGQALADAVAGFEEERRALVRRQAELQRRLRGTGALLSESEALEVLEEIAQVREEEARLLRVEQGRLLEVISPPQLVRFYTLREAMAERIRRLRQRPRGPGAEATRSGPRPGAAGAQVPGNRRTPGVSQLQAAT